MGQRTKGKMWCKRCGPVLGVKNTHRLRNAVSLTIPAGFLLIGKVEGYFCPTCGSSVRPAWMARVATERPRTVERQEPMWTPDGKWVSYDGGAHFYDPAKTPRVPGTFPPPPPAPPPLSPPP